tara:strand:- start:302 stop:505 length:204 start_codon:yes stop_codon:yes gene_type:complete
LKETIYSFSSLFAAHLNRRKKIMSEAPKCGCGRSPTGNCMGWHALSEEEYKEKKAAYEASHAEKANK